MHNFFNACSKTKQTKNSTNISLIRNSKLVENDVMTVGLNLTKNLPFFLLQGSCFQIRCLKKQKLTEENPSVPIVIFFVGWGFVIRTVFMYRFHCQQSCFFVFENSRFECHEINYFLVYIFGPGFNRSCKIVL